MFKRKQKIKHPKEVFDEQTLVTSNNLGYKRIFATDEVLPSPEVIDSFVSIIKDLKEENWLHFHCKEGIGRTTSFMIFYDMMKKHPAMGPHHTKGCDT